MRIDLVIKEAHVCPHRAGAVQCPHQRWGYMRFDTPVPLYSPSLSPKSYWRSVWALVGHLIGTAVIFIAFISLGWLIGFVLYWLNTIHPFATSVMVVITNIELSFIYADAVLCFLVLVGGILRFFRDNLGLGDR